MRRYKSLGFYRGFVVYSDLLTLERTNMPAPKAVLRDISDLGLNPKIAYNETTSRGRLSGNSVDSNPKGHKIKYATVEEKEEPKQLRSALVELPEPVGEVVQETIVQVEPETVVSTVVPEIQVESEVKVSELQVMPTEVKPEPVFVESKKVDKKDKSKKKSEEPPTS
jgi:hypothetical protein